MSTKRGTTGKTPSLYVVPRCDKHLMNPSKAEHAKSLQNKIAELESKEVIYNAAGDYEKAQTCRNTIYNLNRLVQKMK